MQTGAVAFSIVFVVLPLLLLALAIAVPAYGVAFGLLGLVLLATGFTLGIAAMPP